MPRIHLQLVILVQDWGHLGKFLLPLADPSIRRLAVDGFNREVVRLEAHWQDLLKNVPLIELQHYSLPEPIEIGTTQIRIQPPNRDDPNWRESFQFKLPYVRWQMGANQWIGFQPTLFVFATGSSPAELEGAIAKESRRLLTRIDATKYLAELFQVSQLRGLELLRRPMEIEIDSPRQQEERLNSSNSDETLKQVAQRLDSQRLDSIPKGGRPSPAKTRDGDSSALASKGSDPFGDSRLTTTKLSPAFFLDEPLNRLTASLSSEPAQSVVLVGPSGCGKTAMFHQLVIDAADLKHPLHGYEFWQTEGSRLVAGMSGFGQWQERCEQLIEEIKGRKIILHLGNLFELTEVGRGGSISSGIAEFLAPMIGRGKLLAVVECTPQQLTLVEKETPRVLDVFVRQELKPPDRETVRNILLSVATSPSQSHTAENAKNQQAVHAIEPSALAMIEQLFRRFAHYSPMPGRAIRFFQNLCDATPPESPISERAVIDAFSAQTGLPSFLLQADEKLDLAATTAWFSQRVIGQQEPIDLIVDAIASVKANINRPNRPISSFMFIGPTGVGKTEMAKALAEFMFGDAKRLIRLDLSEFNHPLAVARLIGSVGSDDGVLTSKVRENPFNVLLLDEFEKADPAVFDLLLQVLGEGRLTDGRGQTTDFTTTIVILTSNLGADSFRPVKLGFQTQQETSAWKEHFITKVQQFVRPEFFNRIDRIVPFAPLPLEVIQQIAIREIELLKCRSGFADRTIEWEVEPGAIRHLAQAGYHPQYGARPLKRTISRRLLEPLAERVRIHSIRTPLKISVNGQASGFHVNVLKTADPSEPESLRSDSQKTAFQRLADHRRKAQSLVQSGVVARLSSRQFQAERLIQQLEKQLAALSTPAKTAEVTTSQKPEKLRAEISAQQHLAKSIRDQLDQVYQLQALGMEFEQNQLLDYYQKRVVDTDSMNEFTDDLNHQIDELSLQLFLAENPSTRSVNLLLFSKHLDKMLILLDAYQNIATRYSMPVDWYSLHRPTREQSEQSGKEQTLTPIEFKVVVPNGQASTRVAAYSHNSRTQAVQNSIANQIGLAVRIRGPLAWFYFSNERGGHLFRDQVKQSVVIETSGGVFHKHEIQVDVQNQPAADSVTLRRRYLFDSMTLVDEAHAFKNKLVKDWPTAITDAVETSFRLHLEKTLELWN